jgi:1,4-alpha-glucan branching enzyme
MVMALDITDLDHWTFNEGTHVRAYEVLGAHPIGPSSDGSGAPRVAGVTFRVWAPNARRVAVVGSFDDWNPTANDMSGSSSGIWETTVPHARVGDRYKFRITPRQGEPFDKADPFAAAAELAPATASVIADLSYAWADDEWMQTRASHNDRNAPLSVYELHLGSWSYFAGGTYRSIAPKLADHVERMGFTHVELLPIMEHPFYGSWGYQTTGYFAPTARYGSPQDFMWFVDHLHQRGIGVILDWVPSHFPDDAHGLASFDGTHLFEHADPRLGYHPDWHSLIFNYDRHEISSFLVSSALSWLDRYHVDGLRVDAVASMLYRDYSREPGEWIPNEHGGRENLGAITFLQRLNRAVYDRFPDVQTFAEESTAFPMVSRPVHAGGLGFGFKWDMGWMHDSLQFCELDPVHRKYHYGELTFRSVYANSENFILPLSHDEVVHGKGSLLDKQAGDEWQRFAGLRLLYGYQFATPGKKLLFMGSEFASDREWNHEADLPWGLLERPEHEGVRQWVADLNQLYRQSPALYERDDDPGGMQWVEQHDGANSVLAFLRWSDDGQPMLFVGNFTPVVRHGYTVGVPELVAGRGSPTAWHEALNSDASIYGGSGIGNLGAVDVRAQPAQGFERSLRLTLPPLGVLLLVPR